MASSASARPAAIGASPRTIRSYKAPAVSLRSITARRGEPRYVPIVMADKTTGLIATQMVLMALYHRERTGEGQSIEVPMFENIARFVLEEHMYHQTFDPPIGTTGDPRMFDPWARPVPTRDG